MKPHFICSWFIIQKQKFLIAIFFFNFFWVWLFICLFIYLWLCWVFVSVLGLSLVVASGGHSSSRCAGLSLSRPLLLRSTGSRCAGSVIVAHGSSCSAACGVFPDQGSNPCPLHWQADSQPLRHQGSPLLAIFLKRSYSYHFGFSQLDYISFFWLFLKDYFYFHLKYTYLINLASLMKYLMQVYY